MRDLAEASAAERTRALPAGTVLLVVNAFPAYSSTFIVSKFLALLERGWNVHVVTDQSEEREWRFFPALRPLHIRNRIHVTADFERVAHAVRPDVINFEFALLARDWVGLGSRTGARTVVSCRGEDFFDNAAAYRPIWREAHGLHFVSEDLLRRARKRGLERTDGLFVIPGGVDTRFFAFDGQRETAAVGTRTRPLRVVSVGRLVWKKGYDYALQAVRLAIDQGVECDYLIVGRPGRPDPTRREIRFTILDLDLEDSVRIDGARPAKRVRERLAWADVLLHGAVFEGFGIAALEAQAMQLPVVCTDADGLGENVSDGQTGFVVPRRDPLALAEKLVLLARDGALRRELGRAGRERAERLSLEREVDGFEHLYRAVLTPDLPASP